MTSPNVRYKMMDNARYVLWDVEENVDDDDAGDADDAVADNHNNNHEHENGRDKGGHLHMNNASDRGPLG